MGPLVGHAVMAQVHRSLIALGHELPAACVRVGARADATVLLLAIQLVAHDPSPSDRTIADAIGLREGSLAAAWAAIRTLAQAPGTRFGYVQQLRLEYEEVADSLFGADAE